MAVPAARLRAVARLIAREIGPVTGVGLPRLARHPVWASVPEGRGVGVVVVPGFGGADPTMAVLRRWLARRGYRPVGGGLGFNVDCTTRLVDRLERRVEEHATATGRPVVLLGHSRGGCLARLVAVRRPDLVGGLAMLGSPVLDPLDARVAVVPIRALVGLAGLGVRGLLDADCVRGTCGDTTTVGLAAPVAMPAVSVFSRNDGVVGWRSCRDPAAEWVEVHSSHTGMGTDPELYAVLAPRLARWAAGMVSGVLPGGQRQRER